MCGKSGCGVLVVLFLLTAAAEAGDLQLRLGGGYLDLVHAHNSARAIFDATGGATATLGVRWLFSGSAYVGMDGQYFKKTGHQAFACSRTACGPGLEGLSLRLIPVHASIGLRAAGHAFRPYIGLGFGFLSYHEIDPSFSNPTTDLSPSYRGEVGFDVGRGAVAFSVGASLSSAPGEVGLFQVEDDKNFGGLSFIGEAVIRLR